MYQHPGNRPRFLSLTEFRFPLNAKLSAMHRISGVLLSLCLLGFLALAHLIVLHPDVEFADIRYHWISLLIASTFWVLLSFHWLSGLRHLLAEHFTQVDCYRTINSSAISYLIILTWLLVSAFIFHQYWF